MQTLASVKGAIIFSTTKVVGIHGENTEDEEMRLRMQRECIRTSYSKSLRIRKTE